MKKKTNYKEKFLKPCGKTARSGKMAYLDIEHHKKIKRIVAITEDSQISIHDYLYNIVEEHFARFHDDMNNYYKECQLKNLQL